MSQLSEAKKQLDRVIQKARVHLYKPIQIAEILYRDRVHQDIDLSRLETYRTASRQWRDPICIRFLNRTSTSSARYQDDLFNENAIPPKTLAILGVENRKTKGGIEAYIYRKFQERQFQMIGALKYARETDYEKFYLKEFLELFWSEPGLRRSVDKIFEIVVYALFQVVIKKLDAKMTISVPEKSQNQNEFEGFTESILGIPAKASSHETKASVFRVGVTNAADRGLDMWANFGPAIQIKHLPLTESLATEILNSVSSEKVVIVCKSAEPKIIQALMKNPKIKSRVQGIITEKTLENWYEAALRGASAKILGPRLIECIQAELKLEFPSADPSDFIDFFNGRGYHKLIEK